MAYTQYLVDFIVFLALLQIVTKVFFFRDDHIRSWNIIAGGYILFFIGHIASYGDSWVYVFMQYIFGILASIALTYGVWTMYEKVFINAKSDSSYYIYPILLLSLFVFVPFFLYPNVKGYIFYLGVLESITWIILALVGLFYTVALKVRLPKVLLLYLFNIKRTSDVLLISFFSVLLWKVSILIYLLTGKLSLYNLSEYFAKPLFVLSFIYFIWFSLTNKRHRENSDELMKVEKVMIKDPVFADSSDSLKKALEIMHAHAVGSVLLEGGILTERDLIRYFSEHSSLNVPISKIMTRDIITIPYDTLISDAIEVMHEHNVKRLPVVRDGEIVGLVTQTLLLNAMNDFASDIIEIAERHRIMEDNSFHDISLGSVMEKNIISASPREKLKNVIKKMNKEGIGVVVIKGTHKVFTEHMLVHVALSHKSLNIPIDNVSSFGIASLSKETSIFHASKVMKAHNSKYVLVSDKGKIVGIVTQSMILSLLNSLSSRIISLKVVKSKYLMRSGKSYYIREKVPFLVYSILADKIENGEDAICITRKDPNDVKSEYHLDIPIIWLSKERSDYSVYELGNLKYTIERFLETVEKGFVAIDGIDYLMKIYGKEKVFAFLDELRDVVALHRANLVVSSHIKIPDYIEYKKYGF